jgi:thioredoxin reductase
MLDVLIVGGGVSGVSCALVLGSAQKKPFVSEKNIAIIMHQRASSLQNALFNNAYGIPAGTLGKDLLESSIAQLCKSYPHILQIHNEKVIAIHKRDGYYELTTNKNVLTTKIVVLATGANQPLGIEGLEDFVMPHQKMMPEKNRIQLKNNDHLVEEGLYVAGTLAGCRSQLSIAAGSGASVATDILTLWNNGIHTQSHDSVAKAI